MTLQSWESLPAVGTPLTQRRIRPSYDALIVDDNKELRGYLATALQRQGYDILQASCPYAAWGLMHFRGLPRLLVTDVDFGVESPSGHELTRRALTLSAGLRVLRMSGDDVHGDFSHPHVQNLPKPFNTHSFMRAVRQYVPAQLPLF